MRKAFAIIEVLVAVSITALVAGLLLPGIQSARVSARIIACKNNLRQIALSQLDAGAMPPEWHTQEGTFYKIFPKIRTKVRVGRYPMCPSAPKEREPQKIDWFSGQPYVQNYGSDYVPTISVNDSCDKVFTGWALYVENYEGWERITDGLSKTLMFVERAGLSTYYEAREGDSWEPGDPERDWPHHWPKGVPNPHVTSALGWGMFYAGPGGPDGRPHGLLINRSNTAGIL